MKFEKGDVYERDYIRTEDGKVVMCYHERKSLAPENSPTDLAYFVIAKPLDPKSNEEVIEGQLEAGEVLVRIPIEAVERMAPHYDFCMRREAQIFREKEIEKRGRDLRSHRSQLDKD